MIKNYAVDKIINDITYSKVNNIFITYPQYNTEYKFNLS